MILFGTLFNCFCVILGCVLGLFFTNIPEKYKATIINGIGLIVIYIGIEMMFSVQSIIVVMLSILTGAVLGELFKIEDLLNKTGKWVSQKFRLAKGNNSIADAFVTSSLFFVIGAMSILGALDSGIRGNHDILTIKGMMDGFIAMVFTTTMGIGVILCVIPLFLFQGSIALLATQINHYVSDELLNGLITEITAVGGILILGIGLNLLGITKIKVANLLPAIVMVIIFYSLSQIF